MKKWRNRHLGFPAIARSQGPGGLELLEETLFDEDKKADKEKDYAEKKIKLKKDEKASTHLCPHAVEGDTSEVWYNCRDHPTAEYEEFTKKDDLIITGERPA